MARGSRPRPSHQLTKPILPCAFSNSYLLEKVNQLYGTSTPLTSLLYTHHHYYSTTAGDTQCNSSCMHLGSSTIRQLGDKVDHLHTAYIRISLIPSLVLWLQLYRVYDTAVGYVVVARELCKRMRYAPISVWSVRSTQGCASNMKFRVTLWPMSLPDILLRYIYIYEIHSHGNLICEHQTDWQCVVVPFIEVQPSRCLQSCAPRSVFHWHWYCGI